MQSFLNIGVSGVISPNPTPKCVMHVKYTESSYLLNCCFSRSLPYFLWFPYKE